MSVTDAYETDSQRNRNLRFRTYATRLMILAWGIEGIAVAIGLAIAASRVADANMMEGSDLNIWGMVQVSGGFIMVALAELTKIPLAVLLINVQNTLKPIILIILIFLSIITFETVFLSLERGFNFQKSDLKTLRDQVGELEAKLDLKGLDEKINEYEKSNEEEKNHITTLRKQLSEDKQIISLNSQKKIADISILDTTAIDVEINGTLTRLENLSDKKELFTQRINDRYILIFSPIEKKLRSLELKASNPEESRAEILVTKEVSKLSALQGVKKREENNIDEKYNLLLEPVRNLLVKLSTEKESLYDKGQLPPDEIFLREEIVRLQDRERVLKQDFLDEKKAILDNYEKKRSEFAAGEADALAKKAELEKGGDSTAANGQQRNANKYRKLIDGLAPKTETNAATKRFNIEIKEIRKNLEIKQSELNELKKKRLDAKKMEVDANIININEKINQAEIELNLIEQQKRKELLSLTKRFSDERVFLEGVVDGQRAEARELLLIVQEELQTVTSKKQTDLLALDSKFANEGDQLRAKLDLLQETKNQKLIDHEQMIISSKAAIIEERNEFLAAKDRSFALGEEGIRSAILVNTKAQNEIREKRKIALDKKFENEKELTLVQRSICDALIANQIYRISSKFDVTWLFGVVPEERKVTSNYSFCSQQASIDEVNAERVALLWFGSIGLLAATAGVVTAIAGQLFVRMSENDTSIRMRERQRLANKFRQTVRLLIVKWRVRRVKTIRLEKIIEVPKEVLKEVEIVKKIERVVKEIVPVPIFVPSGGDADNEISKVKEHYEELNRRMAETIEPSAIKSASKRGARKTDGKS